jgi:hypothetical protein
MSTVNQAKERDEFQQSAVLPSIPVLKHANLRRLENVQPTPKKQLYSSHKTVQGIKENESHHIKYLEEIGYLPSLAL